MGLVETILLVLAAMFCGGFWADQNRKKIEQGKRDAEYVETRNKTDNADVGHGDANDDADWLRDRKSKRNL